MSLTYATESEKLLRMEKEFFKRLVNLQKKLDTESQHTKSKVTKKYSLTSGKITNSVSNNNTRNLTKYLEHMKRRGIKTLEYIGKNIMDQMKQDYMNKKINAAKIIYRKRLQNYFKYITGPNSLISNQDFILVDICELACRILYQQQRKILTHIIDSTNLTNNAFNNDAKEYSASVENSVDIITGQSSQVNQLNSIKNITETIFSYNTDLRTNEIKYICQKYKLCRPYPGFTDYCGYFLSEILRLPSSQFAKITKLFAIVLQIDANVLDFVSEITDYDKFKAVLDDTFQNTNSFKRKLELLKVVFTQKFAIVCKPELDLNMRAPATRILLDVIDRLFEGKMHTDFVTHFDVTVSEIRRWANNERTAIGVDVGGIAEAFFTVLNEMLQSEKTDREHLQILIAMIKDGNSFSLSNRNHTGIFKSFKDNLV